MANAFLKQYGGSGTGSDDCTAKRNQVLAGVTAVTNDSDDEALTGTMPECGNLSRTLSAGESVTLSEGHYTGGSVSAKNLASQTSGATAEDRYVVKGKTYWKDGVLRTGTMETQSAISFSAAARSHDTIRISWKNPAKGPWQGIIVRMSTSGTPGTSGGTEVYRGAGNNPNQASGDNYVDITGLSPSTTYYFTCTNYMSGLSNGTSANLQALTRPKTIEMLWSEYTYPACNTYLKNNSSSASSDSNIVRENWTPSGNRLTGGSGSTLTVFTLGLNEMVFALVDEEKRSSEFTDATMSQTDINSFIGRGVKIVKNTGEVKIDFGKILTAELKEYSYYVSQGRSRHWIYLQFTFANSLVIDGDRPYTEDCYIEFY